MKTALILESPLAELEQRCEQWRQESPDGVHIHGLDAGESLAALLSRLNDVPCACFVEVPEQAHAEEFLRDVTAWPSSLSLVLRAMPDAMEGWHQAVAAIPSQATDEHPASSEAGEDAETASAPRAKGRPFARLIPRIHARHKQASYQMMSERNLSGFTFYMPTTVAFEGYEFLPPQASDADEALSHEERMDKYDLRRWLARYLTMLGDDGQMIWLRSETAFERGKKGLDIEMANYCREKSGISAIVEGGLGTVRHVLNFEKHSAGIGLVMPDDVYDGSFSLHDVRDFVDSEMAQLEDRGSRLSLGVLGGGQLAGSDIRGHYWQKSGDSRD